MNEDFIKLYQHLNIEVLDLMRQIDTLIKRSVDFVIEEKVWSKTAMYYIGKRTIILALFSDHINIVSNPQIYKDSILYQNAIIENKEFLKGYKITPKGMLQIYLGQEVPEQLLLQIFKQTFTK
ncbi:conserved hypothetical protein [Alteracholeplasma palmae J233]|uniref:YdhG-like domain-containing protein n=1 Tax=Alteracholeplasma palmae (strain ATCC 49389 / J233) TaxID=1318466 RepID=U4KQK5_ALTPJ|nr:hypothetical protein [Alteracholeplasma palmae]CCV64740.1 conserved hypothetical protein [Alteracholeplasma palmae J233]